MQQRHRFDLFPGGATACTVTYDCALACSSRPREIRKRRRHRFDLSTPLLDGISRQHPERLSSRRKLRGLACACCLRPATSTGRPATGRERKEPGGGGRTRHRRALVSRGRDVTTDTPCRDGRGRTTTTSRGPGGRTGGAAGPPFLHLPPAVPSRFSI